MTLRKGAHADEDKDEAAKQRVWQEEEPRTIQLLERKYMGAIFTDQLDGTFAEGEDSDWLLSSIRGSLGDCPSQGSCDEVDGLVSSL